MTAPYILARNFSEAHTYAQQTLGLARGHYRVVTSPSSIKGPRGADLHLVPGWEGRFDRFAMRTAIRFTRLNVIERAVEAEVSDQRYPNDERTHLIALRYNALRDQDSITSEPDGLSPAGEQLTIEDAHAFLVALGLPDSDVADAVNDTGDFFDLDKILPEDMDAPLNDPAPQADVIDAPAEEPVKRRRRRCKECGILVEPDEVEQHAAEHLPTEV